jgi:hypothetical protein
MSYTVNMPYEIMEGLINEIFPIQIIVEETNISGEIGPSHRNSVSDNLSMCLQKIKECFNRSLKSVLLNGQEVIESAKTDVFTVIGQIEKKLGNGYEKILPELRKLIDNAYDSMIQKSIETRAKDRQINGRLYIVDSFTITETIEMSTSLKLSIVQLFEFVGNGKVSINLNYKQVSSDNLQKVRR